MPNDSIGTIKVKYLKNPHSVRDTESFKLIIKDSENNTLVSSEGLDLIMGKDMFEAKPFEWIQIVASNQTVMALNDIMVMFKVGSTLDINLNPSMSIRVPPSLTLKDYCSFESLTERVLTNNASCRVDKNLSQITVSGFVTQSLTTDSDSIAFRIKNALVNPYGAT